MICTTETRRSFFGSEWVIWRDSQGNEVLRVGVEKNDFEAARKRGETILALFDSCEDTHTALVAAGHQVLQLSKPTGVSQLNRQRLQDVGAHAMRAASSLRELIDTLQGATVHPKEDPTDDRETEN